MKKERIDGGRENNNSFKGKGRKWKDKGEVGRWRKERGKERRGEREKTHMEEIMDEQGRERLRHE